MAASPVQGGREGHSPAPENSLTWCLAHLSKPRQVAESHGQGKAEQGGGREMDKKSRISQWRALVAIRTHHIKGDKAGIARFRTQGGLRPLLDLLKHPDCSRKVLDLALSILGNCCTELETRTEVGCGDPEEKRGAGDGPEPDSQGFGNLAMDADGSALIHSAGSVSLLLICLSLSSGPSSPTGAPKDTSSKLECAQSAARALLYLADTPSNRLSLLTQGTLYALAPLIAPEYPQPLRKAALRTLHELTRGCTVECAREVSRSGVLNQLGVMASGESGRLFEELAMKTLANMCFQGSLRPLVGSLGVIPKFTEEVKRDPLKSGVFLKALCLCCKEAVNRAKVKESGGLEVLIGFLAAHQSHPFSRLAIFACVDFVFDEAAMEQLQELGLVPLLVARLVELTRGEEQSPEKMDVHTSSCMSPVELLASPCYESFDFPPPEGCKKEEAGREQSLCSSSFLSLRSWLLSEGLISSEGDLLDSSGVEGDWGSLHIPSSSSPLASSPHHDSSSCFTSCSPTNPSACSSSKKETQLSPASATQPQAPVKMADRSPCSSQPPGVLTPQTCQVQTTRTPVSPSKFSSPHRRRQRGHSAASLTKVTLDAPPSVPRSTGYHHPYHPEPWTPESPILLLLSRFSHATDPSAALVSAGITAGLLCYLTQHRDPSSRCLRMLCRLSCNPNCLEALVRTGSVALIHHHLCQREGGPDVEEKQTDRVRAKVKQLGFSLLSNLRVQCESGYGSGVLAHVMLSGSNSDKMNCALSLPFVSSNKSLLKKLLLDSGGLLLALQPLGCCNEGVDGGKVLSDWFNLPLTGQISQLHSLYFSLLFECLSTLTRGIKTEFGAKDADGAMTPPVAQADRFSPPPFKKPRLADECPYSASDFDLLLKLDDGTLVPANREAVAGAEASERAGSEYFRGLLRGGFGEALANTEEAIPIKGVSTGMLLPVLHYLHGCGFTRGRGDGEKGGRCQVLGALLLKGLGHPSTEAPVFQTTPLGEMMVGACRFLVAELQRELEDLCVSLLLSRSNQAARKDNVKNLVCKPAKENLESTEENLVSRTSELELTGDETDVPGRRKGEDGLQHQGDGNKGGLDGKVAQASRGDPSSDHKTIQNIPASKSEDAPVLNEPPGPDNEELMLKPKFLKSAARDALSESTLAALLPQIYWFSQLYSYPALGRACLALLLGCQGHPQLFPSSSVAGECLRTLARDGGCTETLKRDLLSLATAALSGPEKRSS
ncbi:hypothetical protein fugu_015217 [Takifugu bimaculatus]|uniref:ARMC5-like ARM-repeats domain-containing protein n=1 Tax=Takifugu bimaculatus TaxID=433685 RepID=A0A4Z2BY20_9TELE|nr:hypothetical protein fugu_015217 [Takifugu bimaculatus]